MDYLISTIGESRPATTQLVRTLVRQLLPGGAVGLQDIARHVGLHPKTLQRRLSAEGATFGDLVDQTRRDTAQRLLLDTELTLDQLCRNLGYAEQSCSRGRASGGSARPPPTGTVGADNSAEPRPEAVAEELDRRRRGSDVEVQGLVGCAVDGRRRADHAGAITAR